MNKNTFTDLDDVGTIKMVEKRKGGPEKTRTHINSVELMDGWMADFNFYFINPDTIRGYR